LTADGATEDMELLFARLKNPQGGATINYPDSAYIYVTEPGATNKLRLVEPQLSVAEIRGKALVTVARTGSLAGAAQVSYRTLPSGSYAGFTTTEGTLSWADGEADAKIIQVNLDPSALTSSQTGTFQVELYDATNAALESSSGAPSATLTATLTVVGEGTPTSPPPPVPPAGGGASNNRGGGSMPVWWLLSLGLAGWARGRAAAKRA
jgi:hypothetical protein